jgi:hypothetical protein
MNGQGTVDRFEKLVRDCIGEDVTFEEVCGSRPNQGIRSFGVVATLDAATRGPVDLLKLPRVLRVDKFTLARGHALMQGDFDACKFVLGIVCSEGYGLRDAIRSVTP